MPTKNGKPMSQEDLKMLAELLLQCDERIERLWDLTLELRNIAADKGWELKDTSGSKKAARERAKNAAIVQIQRERLRKYLEL